MEQAVEAVEVDERAEVGDVLDRALDRAALFNLREKLGTFLGALGFDELAAAEDDVLALLVQLDDLALERLAFVNAQILGRDDVDLGAGQECSTPTLSMRPPLTTALTLPLTSPPLLKIWTIFSQFCFWAAFSLERTTMLVVLEALEEHFDFAADFERFAVFKFAEADDALGLVADVDEDLVGALLQHLAFDDASFGKRLHRLPH